MITNNVQPIRFTGQLYFVDDLVINEEIKFKKELDRAKQEDGEPWTLSDCLLICDKKLGTEIIKFDLNIKGHYERFFKGFLFEDGKFLGKIKYTRDVNLQDDILNGKFIKIGKSKIILCGVWDSDGAKSNAIIELNLIKK
jgi:hypothetical protein